MSNTVSDHVTHCNVMWHCVEWYLKKIVNTNLDTENVCLEPSTLVEYIFEATASTITQNLLQENVVDTHHGKENIDSALLFERASSTTDLKGHILKLYKKRSRLGYKKIFFSHRIVEHSNTLPNDRVFANTTSRIKKQTWYLDGHWTDIDVKSSQLNTSLICNCHCNYVSGSCKLPTSNFSHYIMHPIYRGHQCVWQQWHKHKIPHILPFLLISNRAEFPVTSNEMQPVGFKVILRAVLQLTQPPDSVPLSNNPVLCKPLIHSPKWYASRYLKPGAVGLPAIWKAFNWRGYHAYRYAISYHIHVHDS